MERLFKMAAKYKSGAGALALICVLFVCPPAADAHYFSVIPKVSRTGVGNEHSVIVSFTHITKQAQYDYSFMKLDPDADMLNGRLIYKDGTEADLTSLFAAYDDPDGDEVTGIDSRRAVAPIGKEGTVIAACRTNLNIPGQMVYTGYSKHIFNTAADGHSTKAVGGGEVAEIIPLSDLAMATVGVPIKFKLLYKGSPREGAEIEYGNETTPIVKGEEGPENLKKLETPSDKEGIFTYTPDSAGRNTVAAMLDLGNKTYCSTTLSFEAKERSGGGSGGCNAASALPALLVLLGLSLAPVIKKRIKNNKR